MQVLKSFLTRLIQFFLFIHLAVSALAQKSILYFSNDTAGFASAKIPKAFLEKDMQYWQTVMEESHVNPYHAISRDALLKLQQEILQTLPDSISHFQASFAISRLIGSLDEGHLGFASNAVIDSLFLNHCIRFPYLLQDIDNGSFLVQRDLSPENKLPAFSRIISINEIPVHQLYKRYSALYGGLEPWKKLMVKNAIRKLLYMDGITSPFRIKAVVNNDTIVFSATGYSKQQADSITKVILSEMKPPLPFSLQFLPGNIALIEFNSMKGSLRDSFAVFLRRSFSEIRHRRAAGVIIDLRKNGGGDSGLGDTLISYISSKPYRNAGGMKMRISKHSKAWAAMHGATDPFKDWENGKLYEYKATTLTTPAANPLRYNGKVAVLIGTGTFSSANMLTNAIKDFQLATLVGESTAEPANDYGEIFSFMLPYTHIEAQGAFKLFTRANGDEKDFNGIRPDIEVTISAKDIPAKQDVVLDKAIAWVLQ